MVSEAIPQPPSGLSLGARAWLARNAGWCAVAVAVLVATAARLVLWSAGPDLDTDALAHAHISRRMFGEWRDVGVHWVWLPLWHVLGAVMVLLGGGYEQMRFCNIVLSCAPPFLLAATLRQHFEARPAGPSWLRDAERAVPFAAAGLLAVWPLCVPLGQSGQPEPLFLCLVLAACLAWERRRVVTAGVVLALAALLRYEAWLLPPCFLLLWWLRRPRTLRGTLTWVLPGLAIVAWCAVHYQQTHAPLQFLRDNRAYLRVAFAQLRLPWADDPSPWHSLLWYPVSTPKRDVGWALLWAAPGAVWFAWRAPASHRAVALALLGFLVASWMRRVTLGLWRHFMIVVPFYATAMAGAVCALGAYVAVRAPALGQRVRAPAALAGALLVAFVAATHTRYRVRSLRERQAVAFVSERRVGALVHALAAAGGRVYCDQPRIEVFARLRPRQFLRWSVRDVRPYNLTSEAATHGGVSLAVSTPAAVAHLRDVADTVYDDGTFAVVRARLR